MSRQEVKMFIVFKWSEVGITCQRRTIQYKSFIRGKVFFGIKEKCEKMEV